MPKKETTSPSARILEAVKNHPETAEFDLGGRKMLFLLSGRGMKLCRERKADPVPAIFETLESFAPALEATGLIDRIRGGENVDERAFTAEMVFNIVRQAVTTDTFDSFLLVVYWGLLSAQPDLEFEELEVLMTPVGFAKIIRIVYPRMAAYARDITPEDRAQNKGSDDDADGEGDSGN